MEDTRALNEDAAMSKRLGHGVCDQKAFMRAVQAEGREVLSDAGRGWWDDQRRRYPHLGRADRGQSLNGRGTRLGKARLRFARGRWHRWDGSGWVPCPAPRSRLFGEGGRE